MDVLFLFLFKALFLSFLSLLFCLYSSEKLRKLWFSWFYTWFCTRFVRKCNHIRAKLFETLRGEGLRILEIGPARGNNFQFFPPNSHVVALDSNHFFEKYFSKNSNRFPHIRCERFVHAMAEDMTAIADHSMDAVVGTYLLCSVNNREKALKEIQRVLKKGGTYFFMEHVAYPRTTTKHVLLFMAQLLVQPFWYALLGGCHCHRDSWRHLQSAGFNHLDLNYEYPREMFFIARAHIWGTATT